jgi:hypothetical protein
MVFAFTPLCRSAYRGMNCHKTEKAHKLQTSNIQTTVQTMCFCIPPFDFFFKKKTSLVMMMMMMMMGRYHPCQV